MSQLNNEDVEKKAKKLSYEKKLLIFVIAVIFIMLGVTVALIIVNKQKNSEKVVIENTTNTSDDLTVDLNIKRTKLDDSYVVNPIKISDVKDSIDRDKMKDSLSYVQISGLKDKNVEININNKIKEAVNNNYNSLLEKAKEKYGEKIQKDMEVFVYATVLFNGASILSIDIHADGSYVKGNGEDKYTYVEDALNFSLVDGSIVKFEDLFTKDASILSITENAFYESNAWNFFYNSREDAMEADFSKVDYGKIELNVYNDVMRFKDIMKEDNVKFFIQTSGISILNFTDYEETFSVPCIEFEKCIKYINLFNLYGYKPELYEDTSEISKLYILEYYFNLDVDKQIDEDNFFFRYQIDYDIEEDDYRDVIKNFEGDLLNQAEDFKKKYITDDKSLFLCATSYVGLPYDDNNTDEVEVIVNYSIYIVDNDVFKTDFKKLYIKSLQADRADYLINVYFDEDDPISKKVKAENENYRFYYSKNTCKLLRIKNEQEEYIEQENPTIEEPTYGNILSENVTNDIETSNTLETNTYNVYNESIENNNDYNDYNDYNNVSIPNGEDTDQVNENKEN